MIYRAFKHTESGRWLSTLITDGGLLWSTEPDDEWGLGFAVSKEQHLRDVLPAYRSRGWAEEEIEVVDSEDVDPRAGALIEPDPLPVDPDTERLAGLHAMLKAQNLSAPQLSELLRLEKGL